MCSKLCLKILLHQTDVVLNETFKHIEDKIQAGKSFRRIVYALDLGNKGISENGFEGLSLS